MIKYEDFKKIFDAISGEPEVSMYFNNSNDIYMIIKYDGYVTFQKCSDSEQRGEVKYNSLDELYNSISLDSICLKNDWNNLKDIVIDESFSVVDDLEDIKKSYNVSL